MTKIPVVEVTESSVKVKNVDELIDELIKDADKYRKREHRLSMILLGVVTIYLAISVLNGLATTNKLLSMFTNNPEQAQCESIGGRYDGDVCWYNGSKIDVDKYVEEWK